MFIALNRNLTILQVNDGASVILDSDFFRIDFDGASLTAIDGHAFRTHLDLHRCRGFDAEDGGTKDLNHLEGDFLRYQVSASRGA